MHNEAEILPYNFSKFGNDEHDYMTCHDSCKVSQDFLVLGCTTCEEPLFLYVPENSVFLDATSVRQLPAMFQELSMLLHTWE